MTPRPARPIARTTSKLGATLLAGAGLAAAGALAIFAWKAAPEVPAVAAAPAKPAPPAGYVDAPAAKAVIGRRLEVRGWAHAASGIERVVLRAEGLEVAAHLEGARADVAAARPDLRGAAPVGFALQHDFSARPVPPGWDRRRFAIVAIARDGTESVLGMRDLIEPEALARWSRFAPRSPRAFYVLPALSGVGRGGAAELESEYAPYLSETTRVGMRVPILYLRTTRGAAGGYAFDPQWDTERRCGSTRMADDALATVLAYARSHRLPVLVTLNGGIWADATCDQPEWDLNDRLEKDPANCQWNQDNEVMPDDGLGKPHGARASPELARSLTLNVHAAEVRRLKKRNLQQAARELAAFARRDPQLFVGVNLDPDVYVNPFFEGRQWYDYNPGTLRQFREWLSGTGPYAGMRSGGAPDLRAYARAQPLTLAQASALAGRRFSSWQEVDPPRAFPDEGPRPFWRDPWVREWEIFRRHLVQLHYDELAQWLVEAGIPADRIWSSQGFTASEGDVMPFALRLDSPVKNFDSGGVSVEGSRPRLGHLGAIVYGASAANAARMEGGRSLFGAFAALDKGWGAVEFNIADVRRPREMPPATQAYRALRELWNHQARFVSPMAWNGWHGTNAAHPDYVPYTSWRGTAQEEMAKDFLLARAGLPHGSRLWTFGAPSHADDDGWAARVGTLAAQRGSLRVTPDGTGTVLLESPRELALDAAMRLVVLGTGDARLPMRAFGRAAGSQKWQPLGEGEAAAGIVLPAAGAALDQLRIALEVPAGGATLTRIAVIPAE